MRLAFIVLAVAFAGGLACSGTSEAELQSLRRELQEADEWGQAWQDEGVKLERRVRQLETELSQAEAELSHAETDLAQAEGKFAECEKLFRDSYSLHEETKLMLTGCIAMTEEMEAASRKTVDVLGEMMLQYISLLEDLTTDPDHEHRARREMALLSGLQKRATAAAEELVEALEALEATRKSRSRF